MDEWGATGIVWSGGLLLLVLVVLLSRRARRHGGAFRSGIVGAVYDWQNRDKQKALEIIVEGRAAEKPPEYPDGNLPELQSPRTPAPAIEAGGSKKDPAARP
jgi:MYXO-CTERM domain-containing protein